MTSIVQEIQAVRSLRKDLRDITLSSNILNSIETIHNCIKSGTDLNGWKKIDWRNGGSGSGGGHKSSNSNQRSNQGYNKGSSFFNDRQSGDRYDRNDRNDRNDRSERTDKNEHSGHYAFGNRPKVGFTGRQAVEQQSSIPLTNSTNNNSSTKSTSEQACIVSPDGFRPVTQKYVSKFRKNTDKVEDTILNTILLGKLNKFSELNYDEIKEFITHIIDSGQTDMIKCFMKLVFEKAASEEMFCPLYAKLLSELSNRYPVLLSEMNNLYSVYMSIFDEVNDTKAENYNEVCKKNVEKKYRRGYSQFLAELIKHNVIDSELFMKTIVKIISQVESNIKNKESIKLIEEYADCLMKIMKAIQSDVYDESDSDDDSDANRKNMIDYIRQGLKNDTIKHIEPLTLRNNDNIGLSNKARFTFLDIFEGIQKF
jgi:hypothetical protein